MTEVSAIFFVLFFSVIYLCHDVLAQNSCIDTTSYSYKSTLWCWCILCFLIWSSRWSFLLGAFFGKLLGVIRCGLLSLRLLKLWMSYNGLEIFIGRFREEYFYLKNFETLRVQVAEIRYFVLTTFSPNMEHRELSSFLFQYH